MWLEVVPTPSSSSIWYCGFSPALDEIALGSTGDIALGITCSTPYWPAPYVAYQRFNGSGDLFVSGEYYTKNAGAFSSVHWSSFSVTTGDDLSMGISVLAGCGNFDCSYPPVAGFDQQLVPSGQGIHGSIDCPGFDNVTNMHYCSMLFGQTLSPTGQLITPPNGIPDGMGGIYLSGWLSTTLDLGCGPMVPTSSASPYIAHLDASSACIYSHVLPARPTLVADAAGAVLSASSITSLDLGCGSLPAASDGSTFVTRLDASGSCVFGTSLPAPDLAVALDPSGSAVVSGLVGPMPVDLGGGPLAPLGDQDFVLAELDIMGNPLWSKRFGGSNITFTTPHVTVSAAGDVYLRTGWSGSVDIGGGPITAASSDTVVGSYGPSGAHRWSRDFPIAGQYLAGVDGCGALVVASNDPTFDIGQGQVLPPLASSPVWQNAIARYAP